MRTEYQKQITQNWSWADLLAHVAQLVINIDARIPGPEPGSISHLALLELLDRLAGVEKTLTELHLKLKLSHMYKPASWVCPECKREGLAHHLEVYDPVIDRWLCPDCCELHGISVGVEATGYAMEEQHEEHEERR